MTFRPAFISLPAAALAAVRDGNTLANIKVVKWAETYPPATVEDVRKAFEVALTKITRAPSNSFDETGEGK